MSTKSPMQPVRVWDLPVRVFHWALVMCFGVAWVTAESDAWLGVHAFIGYTVAGLLMFRVLWGLWGSQYARFASFAHGPHAAWIYLGELRRGQAARHIGHNPAGSVAIYALLVLLLSIVVSGLFTLAADENLGPLAGWLTYRWSRDVKEMHEALASLTAGLVGLHVAAVIVESWLNRENLARSMITGVKDAPPGVEAARLHVGVAAALVLAMAAFGAWWFWTPAMGARASGPTGPSALWRDECGGCHMPYHPSLLPARSWQLLLERQAQHFGTDLGLAASTVAELSRYARQNAAERHATEAAYKIERSVAAVAVPQRISETPYWQHKHSGVASADWNLPWINSRSNCEACHLDAQTGTFEDAGVWLRHSDPRAG